jgi:hypothetical protein
MYNKIKLFLFKTPLLLDLIFKARFYFGFFFYKICKFYNLPYLGGYLFSKQELYRGRKIIIKKILESLKFTKIKSLSILEIGVYAGDNTLHIAKILNLLNIKYTITCVDPWKSETFGYSKNFSFYYKKFNEGLNSGKVFNLFKYNINAININKKVKIFKKTSKVFFKKNNSTFDLIFIDGSHQYKNVLFDINYSKKFLKNGGLIIGDDYEIKFSDFDFDILNSKKNNEDISFENKKKISFHPGVTMAVYKHFGNIKPINGIFVIKKNRNKFLPYKFKI